MAEESIISSIYTTGRVYAPFFPSRERERPVLNPALALGARITGAQLRTVIQFGHPADRALRTGYVRQPVGLPMTDRPTRGVAARPKSTSVAPAPVRL